MTLWLSRVRIARGADLDALRPLLDPGALHDGAMDPVQKGQRTDAHHRLIWTLFADTPERRRDFLWRDEGQGRFTLLSRRPPAPSRIFEPPAVKPFAPDLAAGDRLAFALRVNATRDRAGATRNRRVDVVMHALHDVPHGARAEQRMQVAQSAAAEWLSGQGARDGFAPMTVRAGDYSVAALPGHVGRRRGQPQYGILDLSGELSVTDPTAFLSRLAMGFGRAKAFGCGLMLLRRV
ncbi:MAG: type I-E CRISPR-associated protein Cas6/Cse3/CasE [Rhodobacteraceae bacterium]|nr:type I-E CRISPR-associated protein Cas6/Cse3/CasE [Paracoccaceae bacterium]